MADQLYLDDMEPGLSREISRTVTADDIEAFGRISGDRNPVHFDEEYAATTRFGGVIAHGMFGASLISTLLGMHLPGKGAIYLGQTLKFLAPVRIGDTLRVVGTVREVNTARHRAIIDCVCEVDGSAVIRGEAVVMVPARAD